MNACSTVVASVRTVLGSERSNLNDDVGMRARFNELPLAQNLLWLEFRYGYAFSTIAP